MGLFPILVYLGLCLLVGLKGNGTRLGFVGTALLSVLLTPVVVFIGLILFENGARRST